MLDAPSRTISIPNEITDIIFSNVEKPSDLLQIALASRTFHDIVISRHINYRVVSRGLDDSAWWEHLVDHPDRTCNIRRLYLRLQVHFSRESWSGVAGLSSVGSSRTAFVRAVSMMTKLAFFYVRDVGSVALLDELPVINRIWSPIKQNGSLRSLSIDYRSSDFILFDDIQEASQRFPVWPFPY